MEYTVELKKAEFRRLARLAGIASEYALAQKMGVNRSTVSRVTTGALAPGPAFIAGALVALEPMDFANIFRIVEVEEPGD